MEVLDWSFIGNSLANWIKALVIAGISLVILRSARNLVVRRMVQLASQTETDLDDLATNLLRDTRPWFFLTLSVFLGSRLLNIPTTVDVLLYTITVFASMTQAGLWGNRLISYGLGRYSRHIQDGDPGTANTVSVLGFIGRIVLWATILLLALDNAGVEINGLLAGLGISGIAVALAVQNVLGDLLAYISIMMDRPFVIGDFIVVDDIMGTVERIGLKSTRVRSLTGELIVFSNNDLLGTRLRNFQDRQERRIALSIGVVYDTPSEKLSAIPAMLREIVETQETARFDRAHFKELGSFSLDFEIVYYVTSPDYLAYMDCQEAINMAIVRRFEQEGVGFAFPTQTIHVDNLSKTTTS